MATAQPGYATFAAAERMAEGLWMTPALGPLSPLSMVLVQACTVLPLGPMGLRVSVAFSLVLALCALGVYRIALRLLRGIELVHDVVVVPLAVFVAWLTLGTTPLWSAGAATDTRAVPLCLGVFVLERLTNALSRGALRPQSVLSGAAFLLGALCMEAPLWAAVVALAALPSLRVLAPQALERRRAIVGLAIGLMLGVPVLVRASLGTGDYAPAWSLSVDPLGLDPAALLAPFPFVLLLGGGLGLVLAVREGGRALRACLPVAGLGFVALVGVLFWPAGDGLLALFIPALVLTCGALCVVPLGLLLRSKEGQPRPVEVLVVLSLCVLSFLHLQRSSARALTTRDFAADAWMEASLAALPSDALLLLSARENALLVRAAAGVAAPRPDLLVVATPAVERAAHVDRVLARQPALRPLVSTLLLEGTLSLPELQSLAGRVPLAMDLQQADVVRLSEALRPAVAFYEVLPGGVTQEDLRSGGEARAAVYERLYAEHLPRGPLRRHLLSVHRTDALHAMALGGHNIAQASIGLGLLLAKDNADFMNLRRFLADHMDERRLDISELVD